MFGGTNPGPEPNNDSPAFAISRRAHGDFGLGFPPPGRAQHAPPRDQSEELHRDRLLHAMV